MKDKPGIGIDQPAFDAMNAEYRRQWRISLCACDRSGKVVMGKTGCNCEDSSACNLARQNAIAEAVRWGDPTITFCPQKRLIWAVPLMYNSQVLGGLLAQTTEQRVFPDKSGQAALDIRKASQELRIMVERANLTNASLLSDNRKEYLHEQQRAQAIHQAKQTEFPSFREMYLQDEPALLAAIRKDDRGQARGILNRILAAVYHQAGSHIDQIKSFLMELVVMMCRTAVEVGGSQHELLGDNFRRITELAGIRSDRDLATWLHEMLERIMDSISSKRMRPAQQVASEAVNYMAKHLSAETSRDQVAAAVGVSPSHFSRIFKAQMGKGFSEMLTQMRIDRAAQMLVHTDRPIILIALDTGFNDQSYFTKVFRKATGLTPAQYRRRHLHQ